MNVFRHLQAILILPFSVMVIVPTLLIRSTDTFNPLWDQALPLNLVLVMLGVGFLSVGLALIVSTIGLFIRVGKGSLAPWSPTQRLVVQGPYRYVRNPMISGVMAVLLAEVALSGSVPLIWWAVGFAVANLIYIPLVEEPDLHQRFGQDYADYARDVPRWIPRLRPFS